MRFEARRYFHPLLGQRWEVWDHLGGRRRVITLTEESARGRAAELNLAEATASRCVRCGAVTVGHREGNRDYCGSCGADRGACFTREGGG